MDTCGASIIAVVIQNGKMVDTPVGEWGTASGDLGERDRKVMKPTVQYWEVDFPRGN